MIAYIKSWFVDERVISNIEMVDEREDKYDVQPIQRMYVQCCVCKGIKLYHIKCC